MKKHATILAILLAGVFGTTLAFAQVTVSGSTGANGNYTSLTNSGGAFAAINATAQTGNNIVITITANSSAETGANSLNAGAWTTITLYPTTTGLTISGNVANPMINLNGADYITIDGRVNATGTTADLTITNTNTGTSAATIQFISTSENNTVKYCTVKGSGTGTTRGVIFFSTGGAGNGNDNNVIENNNLTADPAGRPVNLIYSKAGTSTNQNNNNTISSNNFYDHFNRGLASNGIHLEIYSQGWTVSGNSFFETSSFIPTADVEYCAIRNTWGDNLISGNFIGGSSVACGGTALTKTNAKNNVFYAIYHGSGTASIQGNTIRNYNWSNSGAASWTGIHTETAANIGTTTGNTIGSTTGTGSITLTGGATGALFNGIKINSTAAVTVQNNNIGSITTATSSANAFNIYGIHKTGTIATTTITYNTIGSLSTTGSINATSAAAGNAQVVIGIFAEGTGTVSVSNNTIANLINGTTNSNTATAGLINGIASSAGNPGTFSNNTIHDLTIANANNSSTHTASVSGIALYNTWGGRTANDNIIYNLSNTNSSFSGSITGIYYVCGPVQAELARNFIHSFSVAAGSVSATYYGVRFLSGLTNVYNNIISLGGNTATTIYGIHFSGASPLYLYFNSVNISGSLNSGVINQSMALYCDNNMNSRDIQNNILSNTRSTTGGAGLHYAAYFNYNSPGTLTMDYNDYYAPGTGGALAFYNGTSVNSLPLVTGYDEFSISLDPVFANPSGTAATDYKPSSNQLVGISTPTFTTDYLGTARKDPPSMGAFEVLLDLYADLYEGGIFKYSYARLQEAFNDINKGTYTGTIELRIKENISEKASATLYQSGYTGAGGISNYSSVTIFPTVSGLTVTGSFTGPLIVLDGADNVTFDGRVNQSGERDLTIQHTFPHSATQTFILSNSATGNTIRYCNIRGSNYSSSSGIIAFSTATIGSGNDNNAIENNDITNYNGARPWNAIHSLGTSARENSGNVISGNYIHDIMRNNSGSNGISIGSYSTDFTIASNHFFESDTIIPSAHNAYHNIYINNTSGNNFTVTENFMGGTQPGCEGDALSLVSSATLWAFEYAAIYLNVGTTTASSIQGNTIRKITMLNMYSSTPFYGIQIDAGLVNTGNVTGNTIGSAAGTGSITIVSANSSATTVGIGSSSVSAVNISNNTIGSIFTDAIVDGVHATHSFYGIELDGTGSTKTVSGNIIGSNTEPLSIQAVSDTGSYEQLVYGIACFNNATYIITGNTIANMYNNSGKNLEDNSRTIGILMNEGTCTVQNNVIHDLSCANGKANSSETASVIGILYSSPRAGTNPVTGNTIFNLSNLQPSEAAVHVYGILANGSGNISVSQNLIYNFNLAETNTSTSALLNAIRIQTGDNPVYNNIINLSACSNNCNIYGIFDNGGAGHTSLIYFNTVYIGGTVTNGSAYTAAFYRNISSSSTNCRNNIFANERNGGSGIHLSIYINATIGNITLNYNDYYATGSFWGYFNGTYYIDMAAWRTATTEDANSINTNPQFFNAGGPAAEDYYPSSTLTGVTISGYGTDYFGTPRLSPPEIGALEKLVPVYWTGATSTNWNTASNWSPSTVPTETSWVIIPDVTNDPVINDIGMKCYNLVIKNGATLTINPGMNLTSFGNFNLSTTSALILNKDETGEGVFFQDEREVDDN